MSSPLGVPMHAESDAVIHERASATPGARTSGARPHGATPGPRAEPLAVSLGDLQRWFVAVTTHPASVTSAIADQSAVGPLALSTDQVERVVSPSTRLSGIERIEIYRDAYRSRLVECLADDYPTLKHALGDEEFERLCCEYMTAHPSASPSLNFFGRHMASFSAAREHPLAGFMTDLAALEWAMIEVIHAAQAPALSFAALQAIPAARWGAARLLPSETVRLVTFSYPVNAYLQRVRLGEEPEIPAPSWASTAVFRGGATVWRMDLDSMMAGVLGALFSGATLGDALEHMTHLPDFSEAAATRVMGWFRDWVGHGLFRSVSTD
jgi:hypothetical protein